MDQLTFGNSASLLKANGYAPAPIGEGGLPVGPFAVMQIAWGKYATNDDLPAAVLTAVPAPRNEHDAVQDHRATWLATLSMKASDEADAIVAKYIGKAKCPVRVTDDGSTLRVFRLAGELFSIIATEDPDFARVDSAAGVVPVNGQWKDGVGLVDVMRSELPELDHGRAQQLIGELNALLAANAPPYIPPAPFVAPPILQPGQRLLYGNRRALVALNENGFQPLPVRFGQDEVEKDGYTDFMGGWHYNVDLQQHGVGINVGRGFAVLEFIGGTFRVDVDAAIRAHGACLVRRVTGDQHPVNVAYLFRCSQQGGDQTLYTPHLHVQVRRTGLLVLSGEDQYERAYQWDRDVLTVKASSLATMELHDAARLQRGLEALPSILEYKAAATKGRKRA